MFHPKQIHHSAHDCTWFAQLCQLPNNVSSPSYPSPSSTTKCTHIQAHILSTWHAFVFTYSSPHDQMHSAHISMYFQIHNKIFKLYRYQIEFIFFTILYLIHWLHFHGPFPTQHNEHLFTCFQSHMFFFSSTHN